MTAPQNVTTPPLLSYRIPVLPLAPFSVVLLLVRKRRIPPERPSTVDSHNVNDAAPLSANTREWSPSQRYSIRLASGTVPFAFDLTPKPAVRSSFLTPDTHKTSTLAFIHSLCTLKQLIHARYGKSSRLYSIVIHKVRIHSSSLLASIVYISLSAFDAPLFIPIDPECFSSAPNRIRFSAIALVRSMPR